MPDWEELTQIIATALLCVVVIVMIAFGIVTFIQCVHIHGWDWVAYCTSGGAGR